MKVRQATTADAPQIAAIYNHYVAGTTVTFEEETVTDAEMEKRIADVGSFPWLVCEIDGKIAGFTCAGSWKSRCAYRYSVEISIYLRDGLSGKGIGTALYTDLFSKLRAMKLHSVIGGMALPNNGSIALHEKFGFEKIAHFREVGFKFGKWIDVVYYQKIL